MNFIIQYNKVYIDDQVCSSIECNHISPNNIIYLLFLNKTILIYL